MCNCKICNKIYKKDNEVIQSLFRVINSYNSSIGEITKNINTEKTFNDHFKYLRYMNDYKIGIGYAEVIDENALHNYAKKSFFKLIFDDKKWTEDCMKTIIKKRT